MTLDGCDIRLRTPAEAVAAGIGFIPAERSKEASLADLTVAENVTIASLQSICSGGMISRAKEARRTRDWTRG